MHMLDTNICIYIIKKRPQAVLRRFESLDSGQLCISAVTLAELQYGVEGSSSRRSNQSILDEFVARLRVLSWEEEAARQYGKLRSHLEEKGTPIGTMDLMIAAHALSQDCTLATNNLREFERVPDLEVENWV